MMSNLRRYARSISIGVTLFISIISFATPALAAESPVLATINGQPITEAEVMAMLSLSAASIQDLPIEKKKAEALKYLIEIRIVAAKAKSEGLDQTDKFKTQLQFFMDNNLRQAVIESNVVNKITDEDIKSRYDLEFTSRPAEIKVSARHILVKTEEEAKKLIVELDAGAKFEDLAAQHTTDPSGKSSGGDLGYFSSGMMVPEFDKAAFSLEIGAYTKVPVQTQFGFHIIKLEDKRAQAVPPLEQFKEQIKSALVGERYRAFFEELRTAAKVEILDPALKAELELAK